MLSFIFGISFLYGLCYSAEYVPGTPGAAWSKQEVLTVKSKLYSVFANGGFDALRQLYGEPEDPPYIAWMNKPDTGKVLRLGFHDCIKYQDGTGGCDGCLNWEGVGFRFKDSPNTFKYPNVGETNNNGLDLTVEVLEGIYTDPNFPRVS